MRRAIVLVMVEPPNNRGRLAEWQWPQSRAEVAVRDEEGSAIPDAIAHEAKKAAEKCIALAETET